MFENKNKTLLSYFNNYIIAPSETHNYPSKFVCDDNRAAAFQNKKSTTQWSVRYHGYKIWIDLPLKIKGLCKKSYFIFKKTTTIFISKKESQFIFIQVSIVAYLN